MKPPFLLLRAGGAGRLAAAFLLASLALARPAPSGLPQPIPPDRYQPVWTRSPFSVATGPDEGPKGVWILAGVSQDDAGPFLVLVNRQNQERMIVTKEPNERGFAVESVDCNSDLLQSTARIKTPSEVVTVRFDPALAAVGNASPSGGAASNPPASAESQITHTKVPRPVPKKTSS